MGRFDVTNHIGILYLELFIPESGSLKSKRRVIKSLKDRIRNRFNVSVAEIGGMDKWQIASLGICAISADKVYLDQQLQSILSFVETSGDFQLTEHHLEFI